MQRRRFSRIPPTGQGELPIEHKPRLTLRQKYETTLPKDIAWKPNPLREVLDRPSNISNLSEAQSRIRKARSVDEAIYIDLAITRNPLKTLNNLKRYLMEVDALGIKERGFKEPTPTQMEFSGLMKTKLGEDLHTKYDTLSKTANPRDDPHLRMSIMSSAIEHLKMQIAQEILEKEKQ